MDAITFTSSQVFFLVILGVWELVWKGIALWKAAISREKGWFVAILILNTIGVLPIIYLIFFDSKKGKSKEKVSRKKK